MRSLLIATAVLSACFVIAPGAADAQPVSDAKSVVLTTTIQSRTSLKVSTERLEFDVITPDCEVEASVDFTAGVRTRRDAEVVLTVEVMQAVEGAGAGSDPAVSFVGQGDGTVAGALHITTPSIAARWTGSGMRRGRVTFALRAAAIGRYAVPLRFVLSAP